MNLSCKNAPGAGERKEIKTCSEAGIFLVEVRVELTNLTRRRNSWFLSKHSSGFKKGMLRCIQQCFRQGQIGERRDGLAMGEGVESIIGCWRWEGGIGWDGGGVDFFR